MYIITETQGRRKCIVYKRERQYRLVRGDLGVQMKRESISLWGGHRRTPKRTKGDIKGFSENSRSRLRVLLSTARWKSDNKCFRCGLTFTLPWAASPDEWRKVWSAYVQRLIKRFPDVGMIWRIELTTGKAKKSGGLRRAHVHAIFWVPSLHEKLKSILGSCSDDDAGRLARMHQVRDLSRAWCDSWQYYAPSLTEAQVKYAISVGESKGNGIVVKWLDGSTDGAIHYLCDHTSKHKDEQLGWQGRQWGVVNRRNFEWKDDGELIDGRVWSLTSRQLRRLGKCLRRGDGYAAQPYGDNKCFFGVAQKRLETVLEAVKAGRIGEAKGKG